MTLLGSEKQIKWAQDILNAWQKDCDSLIERRKKLIERTTKLNEKSPKERRTLRIKELNQEIKEALETMEFLSQIEKASALIRIHRSSFRDLVQWRAAGQGILGTLEQFVARS